MRKSALAAVAAVPLLLAGALVAIAGYGTGSSDKPELSVSGAYMPRPAMDDMAAAYFTVKNDGDSTDQLTKVTTPLSRDVTLHTTDGSRMQHAEKLDVPAKGSLSLAHGGSHLMLGKLDHLPKVGEKIEFTLHFATSAPVRIQVPVEDASYRPKD
ncbi:copper chaperone PCu(A)C [Streptomyces mobaraensis NBRC 13819 = DSM 40847]|uniref:Copper chaperone PCu(A)C n=2 Tax=Streptomyces mobaraensis TaxID=35621 RepID=A0A5N5WCN7_STRMB|nr:copper chaperone PCu(A)C [Streptomyces mobaraensis]EME96870.1 copper(I)-binding protein [Streptomyces mobaraensis NBRC 13819 = DSM 40847]KAB7848520.1 copper chaperone PCu(A)C [Streptomyces mobaraensis]QTT74811.1 copper chaperone PCu(A)C [Streptomyces mobaraensis NBRC 13819 = DSM 40847]